MGKLRSIAFTYMVALFVVASLNYIPGLTDADGRAFGIFALDVYDDALHVASGLWAGIAAVIGFVFLLLGTTVLKDIHRRVLAHVKGLSESDVQTHANNLRRERTDP